MFRFRKVVLFLALSSLLGSLARADSQLTGDGRVLENPTSNGDFKIRVNIGGVKTDIVTATGSTGAIAIGASATTAAQTINGVAFVKTGSNGAFAIFSITATTGTSACNTLCATEPSGVNGNSGVCLSAWNDSTGAALSGTNQTTACADTTSIARRCMCAGIN